MRRSRHFGTTEAVSAAPLLLSVHVDTPGRQVVRRLLPEARKEGKVAHGGEATRAQTRVFSVSLEEISVRFLSQSDILSVREARLSLKGHASTQTLSDACISSCLYSRFHLSAL